MAEKKASGYKGKLHVDLKINTKLKLGQKLNPEEHKINYRPKAVRHQHKRVMDHIFGDRRFQLKDLRELNRWMDSDEEDLAFMNSHVIATSDGKDVSLSHSTIASLARSMIQQLHYVLRGAFSDSEEQGAANDALSSMHEVEHTATKNAKLPDEEKRVHGQKLLPWTNCGNTKNHRK